MQNGGVNFTSYDNVNQFLVSLNGVLQAPTDSFTVSGSTLTFASNLSTGDVIDFVLVLGNSLDIGTPSDNTITTAKLSNNAVTNAKLSFNANQYRNIIINGDMSIAQRATSTASITSTGYHTIDRFQTGLGNLGTWTQSQSTDVPTGQGFAKSLKMDCTTADASPASGDSLTLATKFEGQNLQYLKKGTSSAESLTLSFWVKSNKTGTYIAELMDNDNSYRHINKSYTISSADTWEKKTITFAGDTSGGFGNDNGASLTLSWWLGGGSNYTSGTLQTSWGSLTQANRAVGQVNLADDTANEWYITGIQLEAGTTASDFEFLPVDVNEKRCNRYFYTTADWKGGYYLGSTTDPSEQGARCVTNLKASDRNGHGVVFPVRMRAAPTVTFYPRGSNTSGSILYDGSNQTAGGQQISPVSIGYLDVTSGSATEITHICYAYKVDAEL
jgi:hypothetical protein